MAGEDGFQVVGGERGGGASLNQLLPVYFAANF